MQSPLAPRLARAAFRAPALARSLTAASPVPRAAARALFTAPARPSRETRPAARDSRTQSMPAAASFATATAEETHVQADSLPVSLNTLTEDELAMKEAVARFAAEVVAPKARQMDEEEKFDQGVLKALFENGLMGIEVSPEYGGAGASFMSSIVAIEELAKVDPAVSLVIDIQNTLSNTIVSKFGSEHLKKKYLPRMATESLCSFALSESGSGSDAFAMSTMAVPSSTSGTPTHWTLTGQKMWISQAEYADFFIVFAQTDKAKGYRGITCFMVDKDMGVEVLKKEKKLGMRASPTSVINFDGIKVPHENLIGEVGQGYKIAIGLLNEGRIGIAAQMLGLANGAFDMAMRYMRERKQFGKAISDFQGVQFQYAQVATEIEAARLLTYNAGRMRDQGMDFRMQASMAKLYASTVAEKTASLAIEWMGGVGFTRDFLVEKFFRDCKVGKIYEGTSNIQLQGIAKMLADKYK